MAVKQAATALLVGATFITSPALAESASSATSLDSAAAPPPLSLAIPEVATSSGPAPTATVISGSPAVEQKASRASADMDRMDGDYFKGYVTDSGRLVAAPLHWESRDWLKAGAILGGTAALFLVDKNIKDFSQSNKSSVASGFATVGNAFGTYYYAAPAVGAFYLYGHLSDDSKARRTALLALESFTITGVATTTLKSLTSRHRPKSGDSPTTWDGPTLSSENVSFVSGHTSTAFALATVFADQYNENPYVAPIAYGMATLTGLSRIYSNEHWSSDVFLGGALGYFISKAVQSYHSAEKDKQLSRVTVQPEVGKDVKGVTVQYKF